MEKAVLCPVCENTWNHTDRQPVALPACGHTFCRHCLIKMYKIHGNIACPMCRKVHKGARPEDLPANFVLLSLVDPDVQDDELLKDDPHKKKDSVDSELPEKPKPTPGAPSEKKTGMSTKTKAIIGAAVGGASCVVAAPLVLTAVGFTSAGIAGGSLAASMMSSAAIANGGGIAAGSAVAVLQSFGAAGIPAAVSAGIGAGGAAIGSGVTAFVSFLRGKRKNDKPEGEEKDK